MLDPSSNTGKSVFASMAAEAITTALKQAPPTNENWRDVVLRYLGFEPSAAGGRGDPYPKGHYPTQVDEEYEKMMAEGNRILDFDVDIDTSEYDTFKTNAEESGITVPLHFNPDNINLPQRATGGRADVPSIFGEAGPEWAIPEEHSSRTAELLRMAAAASGFTWGELLSRNGGLNSGGGKPVTVVYSPTINANDANGVRDELIADKGRLEKWFRERELKESIISYA